MLSTGHTPSSLYTHEDRVFGKAAILLSLSQVMVAPPSITDILCISLPDEGLTNVRLCGYKPLSCREFASHTALRTTSGSSIDILVH